jgi:hypothetical protein
MYQLLFDVSCNRLFSAAISKHGFELWTERSSQDLQEKIVDKKRIDNKNFGLDCLVGKFHGHEIHLSGEAPIHQHYNAGIVTSKLNIINVHIYFE